MHDTYPHSEIQVRLFTHSTEKISLTDAKYANGMENKAQLRSPGVLVRVWLHLVWVDYSDEYEMMSMGNWNWIIASFGCTNMWWKVAAPVYWWTKWNSAVPYILSRESVEAAVTTHLQPKLSVWNGDPQICNRDPCFQVRQNLQIWFQFLFACLYQTYWMLESR